MARLGIVSPWGRTALAPHRDEVTTGPDVYVDLGYAVGRGFTCRLLDANRRLLSEVYEAGSAIGAYRAAVRELPETATFRGCEVEVA